MDRRSALSVIGVALAGCAGGTNREGDEVAPREPPIWETEIDSEFEVPSEAAGAQATATVAAEFTTEEPAQIELTIRSEREGEREFQFSPDPPFLSLTEERSDETRAVLVPETMEALGKDLDSVVPESTTDGCWRASSAPPQLPYLTSVFLNENETVSNTYYFLAHPEHEGCLPPDTYEFADWFEVGEQRYESVVTVEVE